MNLNLSNMTGILAGKLELNYVKENNLDIAQARLRLENTLYEDHSRSQNIREICIEVLFFSHNPERNLEGTNIGFRSVLCN